MGGRIFIVGKHGPRARSLHDALRERGLDAEVFEDGADAFSHMERRAGALILFTDDDLSECLDPVALWARGAHAPGQVPELIGESARLRLLHEQLARLDAHDDTTVTLLGETGTGKSCVARLLHERSRRSREPFVTVDCTTLAHSLVESELFGHERGAFSGAVQQRRGWAEEAGAGTLFLDEIGELSLDLQAKLLHLLEAREFSRVGGRRRIPFRARVIAATNRNLAADVARGTFRRDLFYRLDVFSLELPPLRERERDVLTLARHFARERASRLGRPLTPELSPELEAALLTHPFEGNVRELRNMIERAMTQHGSEVRLALEHFPGLTRHSTLPPALPRAPMLPESRLPSIRAEAEQRELDAIAEALLLENGNVSRASRRLGVSRHRLYRRMQKFGLQ